MIEVYVIDDDSQPLVGAFQEQIYIYIYFMVFAKSLVLEEFHRRYHAGRWPSLLYKQMLQIASCMFGALV